jgi:Na+/proline symporter
MFGLHAADVAALLLYFVAITGAGLWSSRFVSSLSDFVMPRRFGKLAMIMHAFGTGTHADQPVSVASKTFTSGLSGIWYQWIWLLATPFYWWIAPMMRRFRALTTADVFEARYDRSVALLFAAFGLLKFMVNIGVMLKGSSAVIDACTGGAVPADWAILLMTVLFVTYGLAGGLSAAIITDFLQGWLVILFSVLLLPFVWQAAGGLPGMRETIPQLAPDRDMFSLVTPGDIGLFYILVVAFNNLAGIVVQPQNMGTCAAGKTEMEGAVGFMCGSFVKRLCTVAWCLTGLAAVAYYGTSLDRPDFVYGQVARDFLPQVSPGLLGLFLAGLLATVMGSCDSFMIASSGLFTENFYKPLAPGRSGAHYLWVARLSGLIVVAGGVTLAYTFTGVIHALENLWKVNALLAAAFWLGLFWRRATPAGAWAATLGTLAGWQLTTVRPAVEWLSGLPWADRWGIIVESQGAAAVALPWQMTCYLLAGTISGIVVSLLTRPVEPEKLDRFYALLRTPVQPGEVVDQPCTLPAGAIVPPRRTLFPNSNWEIPVPSVVGVIGFLAGWLAVALIIGAMVVLFAE